MYYRKQPVVVKAIMWKGDNIVELCGEFPAFSDHYFFDINGNLNIITLEGNHIARVGDYIIRGVDGEFYPCKNDIFLKTYEMVTDYKEEK
jgi:hypothetical protein